MATGDVGKARNQVLLAGRERGRQSWQTGLPLRRSQEKSRGLESDRNGVKREERRENGVSEHKQRTEQYFREGLWREVGSVI